jgi:hypothetical protein
LVGKRDVFVLVSEAEVGFHADESHDGEGEYPGDDDEGVIPTPVLDQNSARVDTSKDDEAADCLGDDDAC